MPDTQTHSSPQASVPAAVSWRWMGSSEPLFTRVAEQVERYIATNGLAPGDRLPGERELCVLLGVSRTSVREALRSLQARGIVSVQHGKGVFVAKPGEGDSALHRLAVLREIGVDELFAMREVLEVPAAGWAAVAATPEQLQVLDQTFQDHEQAVIGGRSPKELQELDARLHLQIAEFASNRFLAMTQSALQEMLARGMETTLAVPGRPARSVREHAEIVQAILARDSVRARAAARRHIRSTHRVAVRRMSDTGLRSPQVG
jgi:GntR family transcriptional regulator, transcriptional repressor for pyruvate dehydrogenase complex